MVGMKGRDIKHNLMMIYHKYVLLRNHNINQLRIEIIIFCELFTKY